MPKTYQEQINNFKKRVSTYVAPCSITVFNAIGNDLPYFLICSILYIFTANDIYEHYCDIKDCQEFKSLEKIYADILDQIQSDMNELNLTDAKSMYLYFRFLIENEYLKIPTASTILPKEIPYHKKALAGPLTLNNHAIKTSYAVFLKDLFNNNGKYVKTLLCSYKSDGSVYINDKDNCYYDKKKDEYRYILNLIWPFIKDGYERLIFVIAGNYSYCFNPKKTQILTPLLDRRLFLASEKELYKISPKDLDTYLFLKDTTPKIVEDIDGIWEYIISRKSIIEASKQKTTEKLEESEQLYKKLIKQL